MALFTDGPISGIEDLTAQDSQLLNVASVEGIDVTQKIAIAQEEVAMDLIGVVEPVRLRGSAILAYAAAEVGHGGGNAAAEVVAHGAVARIVYSDAYNSQLNDRYAGKRDQFHDAGEMGVQQTD